MYKYIFVVMIVFFGTQGLIGQSGFYSTVNTREIIVGSSIKYAIVAENVKKAKNFIAPNFGGLKVIAGPMQSTSTSIVNGVTNRKQERIYTLTATKPGTYTIGRASAKINNKKAFTKSIKIQVVANKALKGKSIEGQQFFVKIIPSDSIVYIGQQLTLNYVVYTQVSIQAANIIQESDYSGFYKEDNIRFSRTNSIKEIDGVQYHTSLLKQVCLYPQQTGKYHIAEAIFKIGISTGDNNRNTRSIFYRNTLNYTNVVTNKLDILVKDVPKPIPDDYIGGVGSFKMQAQLDRNKVQNNKAFNLIVLYEGDGDPKMFNPSTLDLGEHFEVYDPILLEEQKREISNVQVFTKKYQYTIVPKKEGRFKILAHCSYYNSDSSRYMTINKGPYPITIQKGRAIEKIIDNTTNNIFKPNWPVDKIKTSSNFYNPNGLYGFIFLSILGLIGMISTKIYQISTSDQRSEDKRQKALRNRVLARLKDAKSFLEDNKSRDFHDEIFKAIQKYLADKYGMDIGNITPDNVQTTLAEKDIDLHIIDQINSLLIESQLAIFGGMNKRPMQETYDILTSVISTLEEK